MQLLQQGACLAAEGENDLAGSQLGGQIRRRLHALLRLPWHPLIGHMAGDALADLLQQQALGTVIGKQALQYIGPGLALAPVGHIGSARLAGPELHGQGARGRGMDQQSSALLQREQRLQDQLRIMVMDAALVALAITGGGKVAHQLLQLLRISACLQQPCHVQAIAAGTRRLPDAPGQIFAAVQRRGLRIQAQLPVGTPLLQFRVLDDLQVIGAGQMHGQLLPVRHQGQIQRLAIDTETVARPQLDDIAAGLVQLAAVSQRAYGLVGNALEPGLDIVGLDVVVVLAQPLTELVQLEHQRVAGKKGVQLFGPLEAFGTSGQTFQQALGRLQHRSRLALALVEQGLLVAVKRLQQLLPLVHDIGKELLMLAKAAFQLLQLHQQA